MRDDDDDYDDSPVEKRKKSKPSKDDCTMAMFCHLGGLLGFILPLIIWMTKKDESRFIDDQGKEALNFQFTMLIGHLVAALLACFTFGLSSLIVLVLTVTFSIIAATAANRGERYRYPMSIRFIS